jgi:hypothetical protein
MDIYLIYGTYELPVDFCFAFKFHLTHYFAVLGGRQP